MTTYLEQLRRLSYDEIVDELRFARVFNDSECERCVRGVVNRSRIMTWLWAADQRERRNPRKGNDHAEEQNGSRD